MEVPRNLLVPEGVRMHSVTGPFRTENPRQIMMQNPRLTRRNSSIHIPHFHQMGSTLRKIRFPVRLQPRLPGKHRRRPQQMHHHLRIHLPQVIVDSKIMAVQAGLSDITTEGMEAHFLAGGNVPLIIRSLIAAHRARIDLNWDTAAAIDLAGQPYADIARLPRWTWQRRENHPGLYREIDKAEVGSPFTERAT